MSQDTTAIATRAIPSKTIPTAPNQITPSRILGCDVAKATIVVFDSGNGTTTTLANKPKPLAAFLATLGPDSLIVCEATGGYEDALLDAALAAGVPAHRADARKVKAFIRSLGILGKTDAIDARALATYGLERHARLARWQAREPHRDRLQALALTRRDLVAERVAFRNRRAAPGADLVAAYITPLLACLDAQIEAIDAEIAALIRAVEALRRDAAVLRTIGGIGAKTAADLLALMPELGTLDRKKIAALAGLAPHPHQSGAANAPRRTKGGRPMIKQILFMPALSAARHDPTLSAAYKRLVANGKKPIIAIVAVMRKMIVIANARLRDAAKLQNTQNAIS